MQRSGVSLDDFTHQPRQGLGTELAFLTSPRGIARWEPMFRTVVGNSCLADEK
jgi:hypothetical protein